VGSHNALDIEVIMKRLCSFGWAHPIKTPLTEISDGVISSVG
jgi:hypothetical protein